MFFLIIFGIIILSIFILYFTIRVKVRRFLKEYFDLNTLTEAFEKTEREASETPKSISSMEPVYSKYLKEDFPDTNFLTNHLLLFINLMQLKPKIYLY